MKITEEFRFNKRMEFYSAQGLSEEQIVHILSLKGKKARHKFYLLYKYGKCAECGATRYLTVDHIIPVSVTKQPEKNNLGNKQLLCVECHTKKHNIKRRKPLTEKRLKRIALKSV